MQVDPLADANGKGLARIYTIKVSTSPSPKMERLANTFYRGSIDVWLVYPRFCSGTRAVVDFDSRCESRSLEGIKISLNKLSYLVRVKW